MSEQGTDDVKLPQGPPGCATSMRLNFTIGAVAVAVAAVAAYLVYRYVTGG